MPYTHDFCTGKDNYYKDSFTNVELIQQLNKLLNGDFKLCSYTFQNKHITTEQEFINLIKTLSPVNLLELARSTLEEDSAWDAMFANEIQRIIDKDD